MKRLTLILFTCLVSGLPTHLFSQAMDSTMQAFAPLVGQWSGSGWVRTKTGKQVTFNQTEDVQFKLDGQLLVVNGIGKDPTSGVNVFEAYGILNYDAQQKHYFFNAYTLEGQHTMANIDLGNNQFDWWFKTPNGGTVKYTLKYNDTSWTEDGNFSSDGQNWYPFFYMELSKH